MILKSSLEEHLGLLKIRCRGFLLSIKRKNFMVLKSARLKSQILKCSVLRIQFRKKTRGEGVSKTIGGIVFKRLELKLLLYMVEKGELLKLLQNFTQTFWNFTTSHGLREILEFS